MILYHKDDDRKAWHFVDLQLFQLRHSRRDCLKTKVKFTFLYAAQQLAKELTRERRRQNSGNKKKRKEKPREYPRVV